MPVDIPTDRASSYEGGRGTPTSTKVTTRQVVTRPVGELDPDIISTTKHEEWTTSRKKVNHKTKQVETRVQRQLILEDGKVIADSGPQVTTHTTEDDKTEETENTEHKTSGDDPPDEGYSLIPGSARVVSEKTETHHTMQEKKEENMQLHDESFHDLSATDIHHKALTPNDPLFNPERNLPGKMTHFSSRSQKVTDKEEVREVSELKDGEVTTETTRTHHHEELYDDEVPEDEVDTMALPEASSETTRKIEYLNDADFDSLTDRLRRTSALKGPGSDRREQLTTKTTDYEQEDVVRNSDINRWLEDHFGSDNSDVVETTKTKSGGNVINIQLSSPKKSTENERVRSATERLEERERESMKKSSVFSTTSKPSSSFYSPRGWNSIDSRIHKTMTDSTTERAASPSSRDTGFTSPKSTSTFKTPLKKFYLGENDSYKSNQSRFESSPLKNSSWKSIPSLAPETNHSFTEERKLGRHESFSQNNRLHIPTNPVRRSMSQREAPRKVPLIETAKLNSTRPRYFADDSPTVTSQTLPRDTKFSSVWKDMDRNSWRKQTNSFHEKGGDKTTRYIHVELPDEKERSHSPAFIHHIEKRETQTLPRKSPTRETSFLQNHSTPLRTPRSFYFGDENDVNYRRNANLQNGDIPSVGQYHTIERNIRVKDSLSGPRFRRSLAEDSRNYSNFDGDRSLGDSYTNKSGGQFLSNDSFTKSFSTTEKNLRNRRYDSDYLNGNPPTTSFTNSFSSNHESRRHNFMRGLLDTSDRGNDLLISSNDNIPASRKPPPEKRQSLFHTSVPPPLHSPELARPLSPTPPPSPPPRLIPVTRTDYTSPSTDTFCFRNKPSSSTNLMRTRSESNVGFSTSSVSNPPNFTPLLSPLEIMNMANNVRKQTPKQHEDQDRTKYIEVKPKKRSPVMVEVRDWDSR